MLLFVLKIWKIFLMESNFHFNTTSNLNSDVCTKYQEASKIVNLTLEGLVAQTVVGAKVLDLCKFGTTVMETAASKLYNKSS